MDKSDARATGVEEEGRGGEDEGSGGEGEGECCKEWGMVWDGRRGEEGVAGCRRGCLRERWAGHGGA